jgi:hypothetical protein
VRAALTTIVLSLEALTLAGMVVSGRWRRYPAFLASLAVVMIAAALTPFNVGAMVLPIESMCIVADLAVFLEMTRIVSSARPRSRILGRFLVGLAALNLIAASVAGSGQEGMLHEVVVVIRVDIILAFGFLALSGLVIWHRLHMAPLEKAIIAGLPLMRLGHGLSMWLWLARASRPLDILDFVFSWLWLGIAAWWAWRAWAPAGTPAPVVGEVRA